MTEDNQHNADGQQTPMQPQPLPGQVFVRPGIDDRPDYEKTLTEEAKAALKRPGRTAESARARGLQRASGSAADPHQHGKWLPADRVRPS